ncbi:MAG: hypothetical protein GF317_21205 [Candidatus Lokiarchaeota archaeon]|nr:hypothetical protein [Candidatus Lokiarchaeota archaeon]MBD3201976.1 hypothetical protein [Candidatus Lokiarchaeota archaeon]
MQQENEENSKIGIGTEICIWKDKEQCGNCQLHEDVFCRPKGKYLFYFASPLIIGYIPTIILTLLSPISLTFKLIYFISWAAYALFFFNIWETRILCNHCPYFANESQKVLHCVIDKGKYKAGTYDPGPLSTSEKIQFAVGGILLMTFPIPFLIFAQLYLALIIYIIALILWLISVQTLVCTDCINLACPLNRVPENIRNEFINRNPIIKKAWEEKGYEFN